MICRFTILTYSLQQIHESRVLHRNALDDFFVPTHDRRKIMKDFGFIDLKGRQAIYFYPMETIKFHGMYAHWHKVFFV